MSAVKLLNFNPFNNPPNNSFIVNYCTQDKDIVKTRKHKSDHHMNLFKYKALYYLNNFGKYWLHSINQKEVEPK